LFLPKTQNILSPDFQSILINSSPNHDGLSALSPFHRPIKLQSCSPALSVHCFSFFVKKIFIEDVKRDLTICLPHFGLHVATIEAQPSSREVKETA
jgi:hypothetical protein